MQVTYYEMRLGKDDPNVGLMALTTEDSGPYVGLQNGYIFSQITKEWRPSDNVLGYCNGYSDPLGDKITKKRALELLKEWGGEPL